MKRFQLLQYFVLLSLFIITFAASPARVREETARELPSFRIKKNHAKFERHQKVSQAVRSIPIPENLRPDKHTPPLNRKGPVVMAAAMDVEAKESDAEMFAGSLRKTGFEGDIVVAVLPNSRVDFIDALRLRNVVTFTVDPDCEGIDNDKKCRFVGFNIERVSINMLRYFLYQWWARMYADDALTMISDFRDVFFQSNPFVYRTFEWMPTLTNFPTLVVFQEAYPNKVIHRCPFNGGWIGSCYGEEAKKRIGSNVVSCSGVTMGNAMAITVYAHLLTQQLDPRVRYMRNTTTQTNKRCNSLGMDQGFHNWLIYSGQLEKYMDVKIFPQGEGPVNTVGAFFPGKNAILKFPLETWQVLRGQAPLKSFHNWNGDVSPVVHQADRFLNSDLAPGYESQLAVAQPFLASFEKEAQEAQP